MATSLFSDNALTTLVTPVLTTPIAGTPETWNVVATAALPNVTNGMTQFTAVISPSVGFDSNPEVVLVTNTIDSVTFQVQRGYGGTVKRHDIGDILKLVVDASWLNKTEVATDKYISIITSTANPTITVTNALMVDWIIQLNVTSLNLVTSGAVAGTPFWFYLRIIQDPIGSRTIVWPAKIKWPGHIAPTLSTGANKIDRIHFNTYNGGVNIVGRTAGMGY